MAVPMTPHGAEQLRIELEQLKIVERPRIIAAIAEARAHGDLKENAEYHAAREQQGMTEAKIRDIESKLSHAQIIDITRLQNHGRVVFGSTVTLLNVDSENEEQLVYQIVGDDEANIKIGKISVNSPLSRSLIGKEVGDEVEVITPNGRTAYEVLEVKYI